MRLYTQWHADRSPTSGLPEGGALQQPEWPPLPGLPAAPPPWLQPVLRLQLGRHLPARRGRSLAPPPPRRKPSPWPQQRPAGLQGAAALLGMHPVCRAGAPLVRCTCFLELPLNMTAWC